MSLIANVFLLVAAYRLCYLLETGRGALVLGLLTGLVTGFITVAFNAWSVRFFLVAASTGMTVLGLSFWLCTRRTGLVFTTLNVGLSSGAALFLPIWALALLDKA